MTTLADVLPPGAKVTCRMFPQQADGFMPSERQFYFRARNGYAALGVGNTLNQAIDATIDCAPGGDWYGREVNDVDDDAVAAAFAHMYAEACERERALR